MKCRKPSHIPNHLRELAGKLQPYAYSCRSRISARGVPHLIVVTDRLTYSICFFERSKTWRLFYPYPSSTQTKINFKSEDLIVRYFKNVDLVGKGVCCE